MKMDSDSECYVYHIRRELDRGDLSTGYIGVSKHPHRRWNEHNRYRKNLHLSNALSLYNDVSMDIISEGSREYCFEKEAELRPEPNVGWNILKGGSLGIGDLDYSNRVYASGPDHHNYGRVVSDDVKLKVSGSLNRNYGIPAWEVYSLSTESKILWSRLPDIYRIWLGSGKPGVRVLSRALNDELGLEFKVRPSQLEKMIYSYFRTNRIDETLRIHADVDWNYIIQGAQNA